jgi:hypothetical protein
LRVTVFDTTESSRVPALVRALTASPGESSSALMAEQVLGALAGHGIAQRVPELLDAGPYETDERLRASGEVAVAAVIGDAHHVGCVLVQAFDDVGPTHAAHLLRLLSAAGHPSAR